MARNQILSREARAYVIEQIHDHGEMTKSEIVELIRPHCSFDPATLQEQALGRLAGNIVRSIRDVSGTRTTFFVQGADMVVDIDTCKSLPKVSAVEHQLAKQLDGLTASHRKTKRRQAELSGQIALFTGT